MFVTEKINELYNIPATVSSIEIKNFNEATLEEVLLLDLNGDTLVYAQQAMASIEPLSLLDGAVHINTLAFEAPVIRLNRPSPQEPLNLQYILDNIKKDSTSKETNLRINQLLIYDGKFSYDVTSQEHIASRLDPSHISIDNFACNISLKNFNSKSLNLYIRSIKGSEKSGFELKKAKARVLGEGKGIKLKDLSIELPSGNINSDSIEISNIQSNLSSINLQGELHSNKFSFEDLHPIIPTLPRMLPTLAFNITGNINNNIAQGTATITAEDHSFTLKGSTKIHTPYSNTRTITASIEKLSLNEQKIRETIALFSDKSQETASKLGDTSIAGTFTYSNDTLNCQFTANCKNGTLSTDAVIDKQKNYKLLAKGTAIEIGNLLNNNDIEKCNIKIASKGSIDKKAPTANFDININSLKYKEYTYTPLSIKGNANSNNIIASLLVSDPGIEGKATLSFHQESEGRKISLTLDVDTFMPHKLHLSKQYKDNSFSFNAEGEHMIFANNKSMTNIKLQDFIYHDGVQANKLKNLYIYDDNTQKERRTNINSDILTADIMGQFSITSLHHSLLNIARIHLPSLQITNNKQSQNNFFYRAEIKKSTLLSKLLSLPFTINERATISGSCLDDNNTFNLEAEANNINIGSTNLSAINLKSHSNTDKLSIDASIIKPIAIKSDKNTTTPNANEGLILNLHSAITKDTINNIVDWNYITSKDNKGTVEFELALSRDKKNKLNFNATVEESNLTLRNQDWHISPGSIKGNSEKFIVNNLSLYSNGQSLNIEGTAGKLIDDSLNITLKDIDVSTIMGLTNFRVLEFGGRATGQAHLTSLLHSLDVNGRFNVDSLRIDGAHMGDGNIGLGWQSYNKTLSLDCDILGKTATSRVTGFLSQPRDTMILKIEANDLNLGFLEKKIGSFVSNINGVGNGTVYVLGSWNKIDLAGAAALNCSLKVNATNTTYYIDGDSVHLSPHTIAFNEIGVRDRNKNKGTLTGSITHQHFSKWACDLNVKANNMLVYETHSFDNLPFYGTIYATGTANINSPGSGLRLKANLKSEPNSYFIYNSSTASGAGDNSFVTFIDSRKKSNTSDETRKTAPKDTYDFVTSKLNLEFMIDVTESLHVKVYTNLKTDDYIDFYGKGSINALYDEKDGFSMKGNLELDRGTYKFTIQDIFPKEFKIESGSSLTFDGDPFRAGLNLKTKYLVPSVSLGDLTTEISRNKTVKVNCVMDIGGTLESPDLSFDLELPEGSEEEKELLASVANTKEQKNMQFIYLIGVGKFYTFDYNSTGEESQSSTAMESLISNTLSGQLNNMLSHIIDNDNWDISGNFSTSERGWNRMEVEGMLRGRLLDNRLLINGNFGYRENPIANSNFIGDFEIQYLLNKKGTVNLKAYSKTNDRYFSKTNLTTQGAGLLFKFDFNKWRWWRKDDEKE